MLHKIGIIHKYIKIRILYIVKKYNNNVLIYFGISQLIE